MNDEDMGVKELFPKMIAYVIIFKLLYSLSIYIYDAIGFIKIDEEITGAWGFYLLGVYLIMRTFEIISNTVKKWNRKRKGLE